MNKAEQIARVNFLQRKMTRYFVVLDVDRDGHIEQEDYEKCAQRLAEIRGHSLTSPQYQKLLDLFLVEWDELQRYCDDNADQAISIDEWFEHREDIINGVADEDGVVLDEQVLKRERGARLFALMDVDGDGRVNEQDFVSYYQALHLPEDLAQRMFAKLDVAKAGALRETDVAERYYEFTHSTRPDDAGNWFFGPF